MNIETLVINNGSLTYHHKIDSKFIENFEETNEFDKACMGKKEFCDILEAQGWIDGCKPNKGEDIYVKCKSECVTDGKYLYVKHTAKLVTKDDMNEHYRNWLDGVREV